jgi:hypothetical protein
VPDIITRKEAIERGLPRYFSGRPCRRMGHLAERFISGACVQCGPVTTRRCRDNKRLAKGLPPQRRIKRLAPVLTLRGVIKKAFDHNWTVRCNDGTMINVLIGDVISQRVNLPLMIAGAVVQFDLVDGEIPSDVEVIAS